MLNHKGEATVFVGPESTVVVKATAIYDTAVQTNKYVTATAIVEGEELKWTTKLLRVGTYGEDVEAGDNDDSTNPNDPTNPNNPNDPTNPNNPNDPTNPENPNNPSNPKNP